MKDEGKVDDERGECDDATGRGEMIFHDKIGGRMFEGMPENEN